MQESELLCRYVRENSEEAFQELVRRELGLVYSAALRQVDGDPHRAEEVAQAVFTDLARKAPRIARHPSLAGWLYTSTRYAAANIMRAERSRRRHEEEASRMNADEDTRKSPADATWDQVAAVLDDAMHELKERDRDAVLLRFFEGHTLAAVGVRLGLSEDAARKRIDRALENLRTTLVQRGVACTAAALGTGLIQGAISTVPAGLAATLGATALATATAGGGVAAGIAFFAMNKITIAAVAAALVAGTTLVVTSRSHDSAPPLSIVAPQDKIESEAPAPSVSVSPAVQAKAAISQAEPQKIGGSTPDLDAIAAAMSDEKAKLAAMHSIADQRAKQAAIDVAEAHRIALNANAPVPASVDVAAIGGLRSADDAVAYFRRISAADLVPQLQYLITLPDSVSTSMLVAALFQAWTERDPAGAMQSASLGGSTLRQTALLEWARADLGAAWTWADTSDPMYRISNLLAVVRGASNANKEATVAERLLVAPQATLEMQEEASQLAGLWAAKDPIKAAQWLKRLDNVNQDAAGMAAGAIGHASAGLPLDEFTLLMNDQRESLGTRMLSSAARDWVKENHFEKLDQYVTANPAMSDARHDAVYSNIGIAIDSDDPDLAMKILLQIRSPSLRDDYLGIASSGFGRNSLGALDTSGKTMSSAMAFALAIGDANQQATRVLQVYQKWVQTNPEQAKAFISRDAFPSHLRAGLLKLGQP